MLANQPRTVNPDWVTTPSTWVAMPLAPFQLRLSMSISASWSSQATMSRPVFACSHGSPVFASQSR